MDKSSGTISYCSSALGKALICDGLRVMTPAEDEAALQLSAPVVCHQNGAINKSRSGISHLAEALPSSQ